jgi:predicted MPP superfamily phosphohydrolase
MKSKHILVLSAAIAAYLYFFYHQQFVLSVNYVHLDLSERRKSTNKSLESKNLKVIQLSDLHGSKSVSTYQMKLWAQILEILTIEQPDFVFITGDFVHYALEEYVRPIATKFLANLTHIMSPYPSHKENTSESNRVYGVIGNHDYKHSESSVTSKKITQVKYRYPESEVERKKKVISILESESGIKILENDYIYLADRDLLLIGLGDPLTQEHLSFEPQKVREKLSHETRFQKDVPLSIVLSHNPDTAACLIETSESHFMEISEKVKQMPLLKKRIEFMNEIESKHMCSGIPVDLILSGHTHGGQLSTPGGSSLVYKAYNFIDYISPWLARHLEFIFFVTRHWQWARGLHEFVSRNGHKQYLYVNSGIHSSRGIRLWTPPEITIFNIKY